MDEHHENGKMIQVFPSRIVIRETSDQQWIFLRETEGERGFPIVIGINEAREIRRVLRREETERPLTHQLAHSIMAALGGSVERVDITDLRSNTYYAELVVRDGAGDTTKIDARPSDALALGLRVGCPIRVAESVLEEARTDKSGPDPLPDELDE